MKFVSIKENNNYLKEYIKLCYLEWSSKEKPLNEYILYKTEEIKNDDNIISILGLIDNKKLIGFISLFKHDTDEVKDLTPWYATMYVKKEYRGKGYSKLLNDEILKKAKSLGYVKLYLKSDLINYYEKFGAKYIRKLKNNESLYYIMIDDEKNNENN